MLSIIGLVTLRHKEIFFFSIYYVAVIMKLRQSKKNNDPFLHTVCMARSQTFLNPMQIGNDDPNTATNWADNADT